MMYIMSATSGPAPLSPCRPAPIRLYAVLRAFVTLFVMVSVLLFEEVLVIPICVSEVEELRGALFNRRDGEVLLLIETVCVLMLLNLYRSRAASIWAEFRLICNKWGEEEIRARSSATITAPALMLPIFAEGFLSRWCCNSISQISVTVRAHYELQIT